MGIYNILRGIILGFVVSGRRFVKIFCLLHATSEWRGWLCDWPGARGNHPCESARAHVCRDRRRVWHENERFFCFICGESKARIRCIPIDSLFLSASQKRREPLRRRSWHLAHRCSAFLAAIFLLATKHKQRSVCISAALRTANISTKRSALTESRSG